ncbi:MAG: riboflavin synthase, partial [candidate division Zixibacteria bacterium]|nr:riboflavin synthase [candidate division Zixibacteria bacterium]
SNFTNHLVSKGSIAVNGISLTVNDIRNDIFTVNIIPYTRQVTTADNLKTGAKVNLEFDIIGKYILNYMQKSIKHQLTLDKLMQSGW